jgi:two-component system, OmpR family, sensor kinase
MAKSAGRISQAWSKLRSLPDRTPLRVKMITAVLALVIIALALISFTSRAVYGGYLQRQADQALTNYASEVQQQAKHGHLFRFGLLGNGVEEVWLLTPNGQQVDGQSGQPLIQTSSTPPPQVPTSQAWLNANAGKVVTVPGQPGSNWLVIAQTAGLQTSGPFGPSSSTPVILVVGYYEGNITQEIGVLTDIDLLVSGIVIVILAIIGVAVVRASLRPLSDIEHTAAAIAAGELSKRVPDRDPRTEVGRLGRSLNVMLSQIETAFGDRTRSEEAARQSEQRMRQFLADASHELRTPLTAIRGFAEYYRQRGGVAELPGGQSRPALGSGATAPSPGPAGEAALTSGDLDRIMQRVEQEASRMGLLVEDMLLLARLDQQRPLERQTVDMLTLAADAVHDARVVAPDRSINLTVGSGAALLVIGDEARLRQVIGNLMSNALSHTPEGTPIEVRVRLGSLDESRAAAAGARRGPVPGTGRVPAAVSTDPLALPGAGVPALASARVPAFPAFPAVVFEIADRGRGLTPAEAQHVFERFYRVDRARTRDSGGAGLGLSIVAALVAAHGGTVWVESPPGGGAIFRVAIPLAPEARNAPDLDDSTDPGLPSRNVPDPDDSADPALPKRQPGLSGHARR